MPFSIVKNSKIWFYGPEQSNQFIKSDESKVNIHDRGLEYNYLVNTVQNLTEKCQKITFRWERYSSYTKLLRHIAWVIKIVKNWIYIKRKQVCTESKQLSPEDLKAAEHLLILTAQKDTYSREYNILKESKELPTNNGLLSFRPIVKNNLIKIGGRLSKSHLPYKSKHQVPLNKDHSLSRILFQHYHEKVHHAGREQTLAKSREKFWIVKGRGLLKKVIKDCLYCKRLRTKPIPPLMGDLPYNRIEIGQPPFYNTGIDYFGPILTKQSRRTRSTTGKTKRWGALFTCLNTRPVHLEIVWDLTTDSFILALRRFCSRRGYPHIIRSDNDKNFVGAESELKTAMKDVDTKRIEEEVNNNQTK